MYTYMTETVRQQQKNRKIINKVNRFNKIGRSYFFKKIHTYCLENQQTIDLRIYKNILRKFKKKIIKRHVKLFVYLIPNNKLTNKSKNSRMGKGKGMFNRYYCRLKKIKPIYTIHNLNTNRYVKLKNVIKKYYSYRII